MMTLRDYDLSEQDTEEGAVRQVKRKAAYVSADQPSEMLAQTRWTRETRPSPLPDLSAESGWNGRRDSPSKTVINIVPHHQRLSHSLGAIRAAILSRSKATRLDSLTDERDFVQSMEYASEVWQALQACDRALESRIAALRSHLSPEERSPIRPPEWIASLFSQADDDAALSCQENPVHPRLVATAGCLLALLETVCAREGCSLKSTASIEVDAARNGMLEVACSSQQGGVRWKIRPTEFEWPLVNVLAVERKGTSSNAQRTVSAYMRAKDVVARAAACLLVSTRR